MKPCGALNAGALIAIVAGILAALFSAESFGAEPSGDRIAVDISGEGTPVIFLPGLMSSPAVFADGIAALDGVAAHRTGFAGMAGVAPAEGPAAPYLEPAVAALVAHLEEAAPGGEARLVGHSMGGVVALLVAAERPDLVREVLVVDAVPFLPALFQPGISEAVARAQADAMAAQLEAAGDAQFEGFIRQGMPRQTASAAGAERIVADAMASDRGSVAAALRELMGTDFRPRIDGLAVPVTVLVPHHDGIGVPASAVLAAYEAQYAGVAEVTLTVVPDSRHFIMVDQPAAFIAALRAFIEGGQ